MMGRIDRNPGLEGPAFLPQCGKFLPCVSVRWHTNETRSLISANTEPQAGGFLSALALERICPELDFSNRRETSRPALFFKL
jgi:hypothetical protein